MIVKIYSDASCTNDFKYAAVSSILISSYKEYLHGVVKVYTGITSKIAELQGVVQVLEWVLEEKPFANIPNVQLKFMTDSMYVVNVYNSVIGKEEEDYNTKSQYCNISGCEEEKAFELACKKVGLSNIEVQYVKSHSKYGNLNKACDLLAKQARSQAQEANLADLIPEEELAKKCKMLIDYSPLYLANIEKEVRRSETFE